MRKEAQLARDRKLLVTFGFRKHAPLLRQTLRCSNAKVSILLQPIPQTMHRHNMPWLARLVLDFLPQFYH